MKRKTALTTAALLTALGASTLATSAQAAQIGFYIGGFYGQSSRESNIRDFDTYAANLFDGFGYNPATFQSSMDDSDAGYGFLGGYRFTPHFAVEGGYMTLGNLKYRSKSTGDIGGISSDAAINVDSETSGIALSALGVWPLSYRWEVYGRGGVLFGSNTASVYYADAEGPLRGEFSENSIDAVVGVGTSFTFLEIYDFRLEYQRVFDAGDESTGEGDADMISLGITVVF